MMYFTLKVRETKECAEIVLPVRIRELSVRGVIPDDSVVYRYVLFNIHSVTYAVNNENEKIRGQCDSVGQIDSMYVEIRFYGTFRTIYYR